MIANGLLTFCCVTRAKRLPPSALKLIETLGALVCWSNPWRASASWSPVMIAGAFDRDERDARRVARIGQDLAADRRDPLDQIGGVRGLVDQLEFEFGGLAEQVLQRLRILEAGHLDDDPVRPLAHDRRFAGAELVDAAAHDLGRVLHRGIDRLREPGVGRLQDEAAGIDDRDVPFALPGHPRPAAGDRQQAFARGIDLARDRAA